MKKSLLAFVCSASLFIVSANIACSKPLTSAKEPAFIIAQYYGIWTERDQVWEQKFRADTPFEKMTRLYIAFGKLVKLDNGHYTIAFDGDVKHVEQLFSIMKMENQDAEIFLSIQGEASGMQYRQAANDPQFAANLTSFLQKYGFKGFDIDWEEGLDKEDLNKLVTHLASSLHQQHMKLTLAVWPSVQPAYDMEVLRNNLDQINIMSYGIAIRLDKCVNQYVDAGFPKNKIIGGIETEYGYNGNSQDSLGPTGTIAEKTSYAISNGLAGMMEWRLDNDYAYANNLNFPSYRGAKELWAQTNHITYPIK